MIRLEFFPTSQATNAYDLLGDVIAAIRQEPRRLDMGQWLAEADFVTSAEPACGTVGCIAGWLTILGTRRPTQDAIAQDRLDVYGNAATTGWRLLLPPTWKAYDREMHVRDFPESKDFNRFLRFRNAVHDLFMTFPDKYDCTLQQGTPEYAEFIVRKISDFREEWSDVLLQAPIDRT